MEAVRLLKKALKQSLNHGAALNVKNNGNEIFFSIFFAINGKLYFFHVQELLSSSVVGLDMS